MTTSQQPFNPQPGDVVQLKSGGYQMTVLTIGFESIVCVWHDKNGKPRTCGYDACTLMPAVDEDESE